jgi:anti-sigma regulatory factor (Ser/Thr protein kinase)
MNTTVAFPVHEPSQAAEVRRAAARLAERLALSDAEAGRVALVVSELATNLAKHARNGEILLRAIPPWQPAGIEIVALDKGPGMPNLALSRQDGFSTSGTLGHGLGAIQRQADFFEIYSHATGTAAVARVWRGAPPSEQQQPRVEVGGVLVSKPGEDVCGDDWDWRARDGRLVMLVADGLGHGLSAHDAARTAISVFAGVHEHDPVRIVTDVHGALRSTRGAAMACVAVDLERGVARFCGVGNISGVVLLSGGRRHSMVSHNGTAGHTMPRVQEFCIRTASPPTGTWGCIPGCSGATPALSRRSSTAISAGAATMCRWWWSRRGTKRLPFPKSCRAVPKPPLDPPAELKRLKPEHPSRVPFSGVFCGRAPSPFRIRHRPVCSRSAAQRLM